MVAFASGQDSVYSINARQRSGNKNQANLTTLIEAGYRIQINGWACIQPFAQYLYKPKGTQDIANALILGFRSSINI